ncbi:FKBP-type peptidyl-prolyl cis-trans isomerase [Actomonas aquatica]|uniref:Peptidyl-prolyl cis-trans isomerase n=1 Tax=Actomonas aquatica TaxID=2866162 RepID=A0ABZ1CAC7_9BACT|nr:FKBP-type peptidyl-prolyl cis-trans isomerase [Opitutus sp. WL0086]WRQ88549.1 FKBP-type peptidyl-prolyl cis-trans isomerase [Opitutus sp. WL0086]
MRSSFLRVSYSGILLIAASVGFAQSAPPAPAAPEAVAAAPLPEAQLSEEQMLEIFGWMTGMRSGMSMLALDDSEVEAVLRGMRMASRGEEPAVDLQQVGTFIAQFMQEKFEAAQAVQKAEQEAAAVAFWEDLATQPGVVITPSGLGYEVKVPGGERKPLASDRVRVHYTGRLLSGAIFDSSEGGEAYETRLTEVIPGWTEGVQLIGEGGSIRLFVPPELAYGDFGSGDIPPGATLIFDVELLQILTPVADAPAATAVEEQS